MKNSQNTGIFLKNIPCLGQNLSIFIAFFVCFVYWIYLWLKTEMVIVYDGKVFENLAFMVYQQGWGEFLRTGPHNEPGYPWLISLSMRFGELISVPYQNIQKIIQIFVLFSTQVLALLVLSKLKVNKIVSAIVVIYIGFSPALVNSALSLWSEIAVYPLVLGIILVSALSWEKIFSRSIPEVVFMGCVLGGIFLLATLVKAVFQALIIFFLFLFLFSRQCRLFSEKKEMYV